HVVADVTITHNIINRTTSGYTDMGTDNNGTTQPLQRVLLKDNLFLNIGAFPDVAWGMQGMFHYTSTPSGTGFSDVTIDHNTVLISHPNVFYSMYIFGGGSASFQNFVFTNNIALSGGGLNGNTLSTLNAFYPGYLFAKNAMVGGTDNPYPTGTFFPTSYDPGAGFVNYAGGDYHLAPSSPFKNAGTDARDLGADIDALLAATAGVGAGSASADPPAPVAVSPTSVSFGSVAVGTSTGAADIQVTNTSLVGVSLSSVTITSPFAISQNYCLANGSWNGVLAPGTHCDLFVVFAPVVGGAVTGTLKISAAGSVYPVTLSGTGTAQADTTPPSVPTGLTATAISSSQIALVWSPSTDNIAVSGYKVFRNGALSGTVSSTTGYQDAGLSPATTYAYAVAAFDAAGNTSAPSSPASATTMPAGSQLP